MRTTLLAIACLHACLSINGHFVLRPIRGGERAGWGGGRTDVDEAAVPGVIHLGLPARRSCSGILLVLPILSPHTYIHPVVVGLIPTASSSQHAVSTSMAPPMLAACTMHAENLRPCYKSRSRRQKARHAERGVRRHFQTLSSLWAALLLVTQRMGSTRSCRCGAYCLWQIVDLLLLLRFPFAGGFLFLLLFL